MINNSFGYFDSDVDPVARIHFIILCCGHAVLILWLGLGTKNAKLGKHHVSVTINTAGDVRRSYPVVSPLITVETHS